MCPLAGMAALAKSKGLALPEIRTAARTGDTPAVRAAEDGPEDLRTFW